MKLGLAAFALAAAALPSTAGAVALVQSQSQTTAGQNFTFNFTNSTLPGGPGSLSFLIRGDFSQGATLGESFSFNLENVLVGTGVQATPANTLVSYGSDDNLFRVTYALTLPQLLALNADGVFNLTVDYAEGVDVDLSANPFINPVIEFPAAIPEPASWAMMIFGVGAVGGALRRRGKVATRVTYA